MNKDVVRFIAIQCRNITEDGAHDVIVEGRVYSLFLKSISLKHLITSSIGLSLFSQQRLDSDLISFNLIDESSLPYSACGASSRDILLKLCENFEIPCFEVDAKNVWKNHWQSFDVLPHFLPIICVVLTDDKSCRFIYRRNSQRIYLLKKLNLFFQRGFNINSPSFKLLIYQLVQIFKECHSKMIYPLFSMENIYCDDNHWLHIALDDLLKPRCLEAFHFDDLQKSFLALNDDYSRLTDVTNAWCKRKISNYEYLIKLNEFAGRKRLDVTKHPIFPWICDFTSVDNGFRPLNRTKYRLTKGDIQLCAQFAKQKPSHHVPEPLSDICYYVYRARIESKETLSKHVRSQWVPEEYPVSMVRLYEWTPDECIPEFFEDPNIFKSIHEDMNDIQLPEFANTPEKFISWHKFMLESEEVSLNLHHWIDLVFGHLLTGKAAIEALNVHLSYVNTTNSDRFIGPVQLFNEPHPRRISLEKNNFTLNPLDPSFLESSFEAMGFPEDIGLTEIFNRILYKNQTNLPFVETSMKSICVTILELTLPEYCRDLTETATFEDRLNRAKNLIVTKHGLLPGFLKSPLKKFLLDESLPVLALNFCEDNVFNLPEINKTVHQKLCEYFKYDQLMSMANNFDDQHFKNKVVTLWQCCELQSYKELWLNLFNSLLNDKNTAVFSCYTIFPRLAKFCVRQDLMDVVKSILQIFDVSTPHLIKIFDTQLFLIFAMTYGTEIFLELFVPKLLEILLIVEDNLYTAVKDIVLWVARRYGAIMTACYVSSKLLYLLPLCYNNLDLRAPVASSHSLSFQVFGDQQCKNILTCLTEIAIMFGSAFITAQYLPFCADVFEQAKGRSQILLSWESAMISSVVLLKTIAECLNDKQLMDLLDDFIVRKILFASIKLFTSTSITFTNDDGRKLLAYKTIGTLYFIADRIGANNIEQHMLYAIQKLFSTFSILYELNSKNEIQSCLPFPKQLEELFTPNFASLLIHIISLTCTRQFALNLIQNRDLILKLEDKADLDLEAPEYRLKSRFQSRRIPIEQTTASFSCSFPSGNRLAFFTAGSDSIDSPSSLPEAPNHESPPLWNKVNSDVPTHLYGAWQDHFRAVLTSTTPLINFNQMQICTFSGHSSLIKKTIVLDNENSFISASNDKTIKLWSLKNIVDVGTAQLSYEQHSKPLQDVVMLESEGKIVSSDGIVHIWDPFVNKTLKKLYWQDTGLDLYVNGLSKYGKYNVLMSSHSSMMLLSYDLRSDSWMNRIAVNPPSEPSQGIKTFAVSPDGKCVACALPNGCISLVDLRIGKMLGFAAASDTEIIQVEWLSNTTFSIVSSDLTSKCFEVTPQLSVIGKFSEPLAFVYAASTKEYVTFQAPNKLRFYADNEFRHEVKLRSDFIAGNISSLSYLKFNKMFLMGSSSGMIRLTC